MGFFSTRTAWNTEESALTCATREAREQGRELIDLTVSNPTLCGFKYPEEVVLGALQTPSSLRYDPDPRGLLLAREAVAQYYAGHQAEVTPEQLILTTSTSEAYSFLFRLLCDPRDTVLVAQPSYPLFEFLADLEDVRLESFPLFYDFGWWIDFAELEQRVTPRTRAVILVHPNNPTGHATGLAERQRLQELCARLGLALIVDEVFLDYGLLGPIKTFASGLHPGLTFVVSGLSKIVALPQMKVGWLACFGTPELRRQALDRLEVVADTFLSLSAPAQHALPQWLALGGKMQSQILDRVRTNLASLAACASLESLRLDGGWNALLRLPSSLNTKDPALELVRGFGVVTHPGSFYGLPGHRYVVISTIGQVENTKEGLEQLNSWCESSKLRFDAQGTSGA